MYKHTLHSSMGFCPSWQKSVWTFVQVTKKQHGVLSKLAKISMGFCPSYQKTVWGFVQVGKNQYGVLSKLAKFQVWGFVRWGFVRLPIKTPLSA